MADREQRIARFVPRMTRGTASTIAFTNDLTSTIRSIADNPRQFRCVHKETRRAILSRFPYVVYFRLDGDEIIVLAVQGRQDPARW